HEPTDWRDLLARWDAFDELMAEPRDASFGAKLYETQSPNLRRLTALLDDARASFVHDGSPVADEITRFSDRVANELADVTQARKVELPELHRILDESMLAIEALDAADHDIRFANLSNERWIKARGVSAPEAEWFANQLGNRKQSILWWSEADPAYTHVFRADDHAPDAVFPVVTAPSETLLPLDLLAEAPLHHSQPVQVGSIPGFYDGLLGGPTQFAYHDVTHANYYPGELDASMAARVRAWRRALPEGAASTEHVNHELFLSFREGRKFINEESAARYVSRAPLDEPNALRDHLATILNR
ncbi:MAG: hypothetical protein KC417_15185, partial [Myxococcales bacterium]|nr:hypothetical protein [Myxococcales bacterium]